MTDSYTGFSQFVDFWLGEVNAMGEPDIIGAPPHLFKVFQWSYAKFLNAESIFIQGLCQVGVQAYLFFAGALGFWWLGIRYYTSTGS